MDFDPIRLIDALLQDELFARERALDRAIHGQPSENHIPDNEEDMANIRAAIALWESVKPRRA